MSRIIKLTESDLTNIVKRVIKESAAKDYLIDMVKYNGWKSTSDLVGGVENLKKLVDIETPMDFLNLFNDLDIVPSERKPEYTLFRYKKGKNEMMYNRNDNIVYIRYNEIWSFLKNVFELTHSEIQELTKEWLSDVYNLKGVTTDQRIWTPRLDTV